MNLKYRIVPSPRVTFNNRIDGLLLLAIVVIVLGLSNGVVFAEEESAAIDAKNTIAKSEDSKVSTDVKSPSSSEPIHVKSKKRQKIFYHNGVFYGDLYFLSPELDSIVVKPNREGRRLNRLPNKALTFYLDRHTRYYVDGHRVKADEIFPGDKVAVRYFAEERLAIAEAVYVVFDDYKVRDYRRKTRH